MQRVVRICRLQLQSCFILPAHFSDTSAALPIWLNHDYNGDSQSQSRFEQLRLLCHGVDKTHGQAEASCWPPLRKRRRATVRSRQIPLVFAARRIREPTHVERSLVAKEVGRTLGMRLVWKVVLPESVDLVRCYRLVLCPVEEAGGLVRQINSATRHTDSSKQINK